VVEVTPTLTSKDGSQDSDDLLTVRQVAQQLKLDPGTLNRWRANGFGPPFCRLGRRIRYRRAALEQWVASRELAFPEDEGSASECGITQMASPGGKDVERS